MSTPITIKTLETWYHRFRCVICDQETNKCSVQAVAFEGVERLGVVCDTCLQSPDMLIARAHAHAAELRQYAEALDAITIGSMVSLADKRAAERAREEEIMRANGYPDAALANADDLPF